MTHKALIFATTAVLVPVVTQAQNSATPASAPSSVSREAARTIIEAAITYTRDIPKSRMAVVVLDNAGHTVSSDRMDGAAFYLEKFARGKAYLSIITRRSTQEAADLAKTRPDRYFWHHGDAPRRGLRSWRRATDCSRWHARWCRGRRRITRRRR